LASLFPLFLSCSPLFRSKKNFPPLLVFQPSL
jgi:hypothetical protein